MPAKRDNSHLPVEEQEKIELQRARKLDLQRARRAADPEKDRQWARASRKNNPEKARVKDKRWRESNPDKTTENWANYYAQNREALVRRASDYGVARRKADPEGQRKYDRKLYEANKANRKLQRDARKASRTPDQLEAERGRRREYIAQRKESDPMFRVQRNLRANHRQAFVSGYKKGSAVRDLGCSIDELKVYLEGRFEPGMTWENYGRGPKANSRTTYWEIDHRIPMATVNMGDRNDWLKIVHFSNLQPMWHEDNRSKGDKIILNGVEVRGRYLRGRAPVAAQNDNDNVVQLKALAD